MISIVLRLLKKEFIHQPKFDDIDPKFGLHDYTVKVEIRNDQRSFWNEHFTHLFFKDFSKGYANLNLIDSN